MGDARRYGGREERHLTFGRSLLQDPLDVLDEPMSSISSASSRTKKRMSASFSVPRRMWSMTRPGVPTTICTPRCKPRNCRSYGWPP